MPEKFQMSQCVLDTLTITNYWVPLEKPIIKLLSEFYETIANVRIAPCFCKMCTVVV